LFWGVSGIIAVIFQQSYTSYLKKKLDAEEEGPIEVKPVEVDVERKVRKKRPTKKK
jgi:YidC/Oxa1 family membrane protein insertase